MEDKNKVANLAVNIKKGNTLNYSFDHPNYVRRVQSETYTKVLSDGTEVERVKDDMILTEEMPHHIKSAIGGFTVKTPLGMVDTRNRPTHRLGKKNQNLTKVLTKAAMKHIKEGNSKYLKYPDGTYKSWVFKYIRVQQTSSYRKRNR